MIENIKWLFETASIQTIILNIISSAIFGFIIWSTKNIWFNKLSDAMLKRYFLTINDTKIFPDRRRTHKIINQEIDASDSICILTMFGRRTFELYPNIWNNKDKEIEIIISGVNSELFKDLDFNNSFYANNILNNVSDFINNKKIDYQNLKVYTQRVDLPFTLNILDRCIYVKFYNLSKQYNTLNISRYGKESDEFCAFKKYYNSVKKSAYKE